MCRTGSSSQQVQHCLHVVVLTGLHQRRPVVFVAHVQVRTSLNKKSNVRPSMSNSTMTQCGEVLSVNTPLKSSTFPVLKQELFLVSKATLFILKGVTTRED